MSYGSRTQYPRTSRTTRGRGRGRSSYTPHVMNNQRMAEEEESPNLTDQGGFDGDDRHEQGAGGRRGSAGGRGERKMQR